MGFDVSGVHHQHLWLWGIRRLPMPWAGPHSAKVEEKDGTNGQGEVCKGLA